VDTMKVFLSNVIIVANGFVIYIEFQ